jgi:hypothetical protein
LEQVYEAAKFPGIHKIVAPAHFQERDSFLRRIQLVKLHGCINDDSKELTFGLVEYGDRAAALDMWYLHFVQDYSTRNTLFIGTQLDEPLFWQYIQLRQQRERDVQERRPKSFLVAPDISRPMEEVLGRFNVVSIRATGDVGATIDKQGSILSNDLGTSSNRDVHVSLLSWAFQLRGSALYLNPHPGFVKLVKLGAKSVLFRELHVQAQTEG